MYTPEQKETMFNKVISAIESGLSLRAALIKTDVSRTIFENDLKSQRCCI